MPRTVRFKTLIVKAIGVVSTVAGGLAGGKVSYTVIINKLFTCNCM